MSTSQTSLTSAADERKARLAKLASLKRKQPGSDTTVFQTESPADSQPSEPPSETQPLPTHLSYRNYDPTTRAPRLGFDSSTTLLETQPTVESQSTTLLTDTLSTAEQQEADLRAKEASGTGGVDLFKLQPKKLNWDLKRELQERYRRYGVEQKTQSAIARLVRERIEGRKREAVAEKQKQGESSGQVERDGEGEEVGIEGADLVQGVHQREREEEEEERRERELDQELEGEGVP